LYKAALGVSERFFFLCSPKKEIVINSLFLIRNYSLFGKFLFVFTLYVCLTSCEIINPAEPIPSLIAIDSNHFTAGIGQGTSSSAILDSWVYVDNDLQGTYEMPFNIPMQYTGPHKITIRSGIKVNGLTAVRSVNPLYTNYDTIVNLEPEKSIKIRPTSTYVASTVVNIVDDFDTGTSQFDIDADSDTLLYSTSDDAFEGPFSGVFYFSGTRTRFSATSLNKYVLTKGKYNIIELNYNCNNSFVVGLVRNYLGSSARIQILAMLPTNGKWKKIYISLIDAVNNLDADNYNIYLYSQLDQGNTSAKVLIDNLKLVHN
jgi:hypothetical protein